MDVGMFPEDTVRVIFWVSLASAVYWYYYFGRFLAANDGYSLAKSKSFWLGAFAGSFVWLVVYFFHWPIMLRVGVGAYLVMIAVIYSRFGCYLRMVPFDTASDIRKEMIRALKAYLKHPQEEEPPELKLTIYPWRFYTRFIRGMPVGITVMGAFMYMLNGAPNPFFVW